jgi:hypothetical protein
VTAAYDRRSALVHGRQSKETVPLDDLRRVCQRVLSVILIYASGVSKLDALATSLARLPISDASLTRAREARDAVLATIAEADARPLKLPSTSGRSARPAPRTKIF